MTTTIKSTELDFEAIKNSLKIYLAQQPEFADYRFEASGLSNLLDVLAYNTHYNGLLANFALNESFLSTAQLRSSLVSLAGNLGYTVGSRNSSFAIVNISVINNSNPSKMTLPAGFAFTSTIDNKSYTFKTRDTMTATNDGTNNYVFSLNGNVNVPIYEGVNKNKTFIAGPVAENETYVIPVTNLDLQTVTVKVYDSVSSNIFSTYTNINDATSISSTSKIYSIKETPNGFYEVTFANGVDTERTNRYGASPQPGNKIEISYDVTVGPEANGARTFNPSSTLDGLTVNVSTVSSSAAGSNKEDLESIRKNAPYLYATQNRMVTAEDYSALILRNFSNVIEDIKSWGGEDNIPPKYGTVYVSIDFSTDDEAIQTSTKADIVNLAKDLSVASFDVEFEDPSNTYLEIETIFQWNSNLTNIGLTAIEANTKSAMQTYFDANLGSFDKSFRRSNLLTVIDESDPSILSSRANVKMQYRFTPVPLQNSYTVNFPASIISPDDVNYSITSSSFYINGEVCKLRNKLNTNIMEVLNTNTGKLEVDNVGSFNPVNGTISLSGFEPTLISGDYFKIVAVPANQATINPQRSNILNYDAQSSVARAIITDTL
jgi:hypothetical protein